MADLLPVSPAGRRYGRLRDFFDPRDLILSKKEIPKRAPRLPQSVDLTEFCGPIKDQGNLGSCVGHAYSSVLEFLVRKGQALAPIFSPLFCYYTCRIIDDSTEEDAGAMSKSGCVALAKYGCCEESIDPYVISDFTKHPTEEQLANGLKWKGDAKKHYSAYHRILPLPDMLSCLASGYPFTIGFSVYKSFEDKWKVDGVMPIPNPSREMLMGGHEVFAVGYDMKKKAVLIQNSWGTDFALGGRFWMPFEFISDGYFVSDIWLFHLGKPWVKK